MLLLIHSYIHQIYVDDQIVILMELEYEYGPLPGFSPAVRDVIDYLEIVCGILL